MLALASRQKSVKRLKLFLVCSEAAVAFEDRSMFLGVLTEKSPVQKHSTLERDANKLRETDILLPNNQHQHQHRTSHAPKDVLSLHICANHCAATG